MIVFVDYEHELGRSQPWGEKILAARTWITYRLEDLSGQHCMLVRYDKITPQLMIDLDATALFISGNGTDLAHYDQASLDPLRSIVAARRIPQFGLCGGFQFIAETLGAEVVPLGGSLLSIGAESEETNNSSDNASDSAPETIREVGYSAVDILADHPILAGLDDRPVFRHAHSLHVPQPPAGFDVVASTEITPVQMAINDEHRIVGTQFHPEYWTDEHPAGRTMISNFLSWSGVFS